MASGKSTVGKLLAQKLGYDFIDSDTGIEQLKGSAIEDIFSKRGEKWFRREEGRIIRFVSELDKIVISTGGGLPIYNDNLSVMLHNGITIYLELSEKVLAKRILADIKKRPLHDQSDAIDLEAAVSIKLKERQKYYREAHLTLNGNTKPELIVDKISSMILGAY